MKRLLLPLLAGVLLLAGCGGTKLQPPTAGIQQLKVRADHDWDLTLRIQNYSYDTGMHVAALDATLALGGKDAGTLHLTPALDIPAMNADVAATTLMPAADARALLAAAKGKGNSIGYTLKGFLMVSKSDADKPERFPLDASGFLSPVPGVADTWR